MSEKKRAHATAPQLPHAPAPLPSQAVSHNRRAWDENVQRQQRHTIPATSSQYENPLAHVDPCGWLGGNVRGQRLLCLAAGGGKHSTLFATAGALVTVVDVSPKQLEQDRLIAKQRGLDVRVVEASMDDLSALADASFDIVVQPVSTCYVPDVRPVYREVARVLATGGVYVSQHKQPVNQQAAALPIGESGYVLTEPYYRTGPLPPMTVDAHHREIGTQGFLHRWEELLGELCKAGFVIEAVTEPKHADPLAAPGTFRHRSAYVPPFIKVKARRLMSAATTKRLIV
jgi:2-polyprenyl-3-methyl-5-hydroxy-6-metoxy-1,4-benzoquinol methylase